MSCRVALVELGRRGVLHLPPARPAPPKRTRPEHVLESFQDEPAIQCALSQFGELTLVLINGSNTKASRQWNALMNQYNYLGSGPLCGAQLRYLIHRYRYYDEEEFGAVELGDVRLFTPHYESTVNRVAKENVALAVQDTTYLNYTAHPDTEGLGPIGNRNDDGAIGLVLHDTLAFNLEGTPLGLMNVQCWARAFAEAGREKRRPKELPIAEKESNKWLVSYRAVAAAQKRCPQTMLVSVGDREADVYELFHEALSDPQNPDLLIRANRDRLLNEGQEHLWDYVKMQSLRGTQHVQVPRQGQRHVRLSWRFALRKSRSSRRSLSRSWEN